MNHGRSAGAPLPGVNPPASTTHAALGDERREKLMGSEGVRDVITALAEAADVRPWYSDGTRGEPVDVTPHTFRHSVAYRMLVVEDGNTLDDVQRRLRHASRSTTEREYSHWDTV